MQLNSFDAIRNYFATTETPYYFVSSTNFNLMNMHQWVKHWKNINYLDCYDGQAGHVYVPPEEIPRSFASIEEVSHYLLEHPKSKEQLERAGEIIYLFFDKELEEATRKAGLKILRPPFALVHEIDNKITTTEIGNRAGVFSVPNVLARVDSYQTLKRLAQEHQLGDKLVVQSAYGDSGKTTFFINSEEDYQRSAAQIESEEKVKVMKQIRCVGTAIEACATRHGTYVGPLLSELIGFSELTPYQGGWCGNELYQDAFSETMRAGIHQKTEQLGNELYRRGYKGYFEVDYLIDLESNEIWLGELNPRITGITALTNLSPFCQKTMPLFLFHLLEYSELEWQLPPREYNSISLEEGAFGTSSQLICKYTDKQLQKVIHAPVSGIYRLAGDTLELVQQSATPTDKGLAEDHCFLLRLMKEGDYAYSGGDLAILLLNTQLTQAEGTELNSTAQSWIHALHQCFDLQELTDEERELISRYNRPMGIKASGDKAESQ